MVSAPMDFKSMDTKVGPPFYQNVELTKQEIKPRMKDNNSSGFYVQHNYHDHSHVTMLDFIEIKLNDKNLFGGKKPNIGFVVSFPFQLHHLLSEAEDDGFADIISWQPHGRCFIVHDPQELVNKILPLYSMNQTKYTSFQRQLNLYGFRRLSAGRDKGSYYHEFFLRHKMYLCELVFRTSVKGIGGKKPKPNPEHEPDFYSMPFLTPDKDFVPNTRVHQDKTSRIDNKDGPSAIDVSSMKSAENEQSHGSVDKLSSESNDFVHTTQSRLRDHVEKVDAYATIPSTKMYTKTNSLKTADEETVMFILQNGSGNDNLTLSHSDEVKQETTKKSARDSSFSVDFDLDAFEFDKELSFLHQ